MVLCVSQDDDWQCVSGDCKWKWGWTELNHSLQYLTTLQRAHRSNLDCSDSGLWHTSHFRMLVVLSAIVLDGEMDWNWTTRTNETVVIVLRVWT